MNPFVYADLAREEHFFDREEETRYIMSTLTSGNNMVLYAPRRYGKTSLVYHVMEKLEKEKYTCIYFDFMKVFSVENFVRMYTKALYERQNNLQKISATLVSTLKSIRPMVVFDDDGKPEVTVDIAHTPIDINTIENLIDVPEKIAESNKEINKVIVFFDEFQEVERLKDIHMEALLRSKIQFQAKTSYCFLGSKKHLLQDMFLNYKRPFYNSVAHLSIGPLAREDTIKYLQTGFENSKILLTKDDIIYLIEKANDIPYYIQMLASEVWEYSVGTKEPVNTNVMDICVKRIIKKQSGLYYEIFDRQTKGKKELLIALINDGFMISSMEFIKKHNLSSITTVQNAAKSLLNDSIVEKDKDRWFIADPFFRTYIKQVINGTGLI
ncbi:MAG: ATP-binding protein [Spirochaetaceae bacterium]|jgi:AAA+ ATPase superfamily predicted ATPase|nr:ATP-binding protein [Spirochaetaceae bacterium]